MRKFKAIFAAAVIGLSATVAAGPVLAGPQIIRMESHKGEGPISRTLKRAPQQKHYRHNSRDRDYRHHDRRDHRASRSRHHRSWMKRGGHMPRAYRGKSIDYRRHHLNKPPRGYHWVRHDDNYVLVAITSGIISSIINANR